MQRQLHTLSTLYQYDPVHTAKPPPPVSSPDHQLSSDERVLNATFTGPYTVGSHPNYGTPSQYTTNVGYDDPSSPVAGLEERPQYAYQGAPHFPPPGTAQHTFDLPIIPGPLRPEYNAPALARPQMLNDGTIGQPPNVAGPSQGVPGPVLHGMSAGEELRQLANRYVHDPDSRVDRVRVRRSRRSGKVKVMILLELDDME
ncbi:hypothetical protein BGW80DRAFT_1564813 [Lactifluus volemus]|nr:hypothetical protein BGW80DRAFT_1564813 [Lactifluus volemus]